MKLAADGAPARWNWQFWACLVLFGLAAFAVRYGLATAVPNIHRPDEIFQGLEPAHRLWSGWGVITWEWRAGIRSWFFPGFLLGLMSLSSQLGLGPEGYLRFIPMTLSLLSLGVVAVGIMLGWLHSRLVGAVLCGVLCSFWPDLIYFAPKTLTEIQGGNLLAIAAGLASVAGLGKQPRAGVPLIFAIGVLLGLAFCVRFQLAPAIAVVGLWTARMDLRRGWLPLAAGGAIPLAVLGGLDYATLGSPFQSIWKNFYLNIVEERADQYGAMATYHYFKELARYWGGAVVLVGVFFCIGARKVPLLAVTAIVVVASHSLVSHKEISFIYAAIPLALIVAGLGTAEVLLALPRMLTPRVDPRAALAAAAGFWFAICGLTAISGYETVLRRGAKYLKAAEVVRSKPDLCGLGLLGDPFPWYLTGGYTYLNRPVPMHLLGTRDAPAAAQSGFNYVISESGLAQSLAEYERVGCWDGLCLLRHDRPCSDNPETEIDAVLTRLNQ